MDQAAEPCEAEQRARTGLNAYPCYAFRIWYGMLASALLPLLARHRFAVSPMRIPFVLVGIVTSIFNSSARLLQTLIFARRIRASVLATPPIFIIGHWRTGTTHLHELLTLDERFAAPTTLECFAPSQALVFGWLLRLFTFFLPARRPMDDMPVGWDHPQEDEFALMNFGLGSPYEDIMFPNHRPARRDFLTMADVGPKQLETWKAGLLEFLQQVNYRGRRARRRSGVACRIVLKSPTHTARLRILWRMFPDAQFIHIVRNPLDVFASTMRLWQGLFATQGCQTADFGPRPDGTPDIAQYVFDRMDLLYRNFFTEVAAIPARNFCEVRYEDLVQSPVAEIGRIYRHLGLGGFDTLRPKLAAHLATLDGYRTNRHRMSDVRKAEVCRRWGWYMERFGYRVPALPGLRWRDSPAQRMRAGRSVGAGV